MRTRTDRRLVGELEPAHVEERISPRTCMDAQEIAVAAIWTNGI
ncbi:MAG: hypothetical protein ABR548_13005 [Actinomycetota bacterium]